MTTVAISGVGTLGVYSAANCNASSGKNTVTATYTLSTAARVRLWIAEYANTTVTANATSNTITGGSISATVSSSSGALVVAAGMSNATAITAGASYSGRKTDGAFLLAGTGAGIIALSIGSAAAPVAYPQVFIVT